MSEKNEMSYEALTQAGSEKYFFTSDHKIDYPSGTVTDFYGYRRHNIEVDGCEGFIVEPPHPAPGLPWSWCIQWPEAFVRRTPALQLLERGFHHVFLNIFPTYMNDRGVQILEKFYALLQSMHFHKKCALIGLSYGGLFSLRWAAEHPETVGAMYLDAPVCNLAFCAERLTMNPTGILQDFIREESQKHMAAYQVESAAELFEHPKNPLNNYLPVIRAAIPILAIRSGQDQTVLPERNIDLLAEAIQSGGGNIQILRRDLYGHHPHGLDDPTPLTGFILKHYPEL